MPFRWREIFEKENQLTKAKADAAVEAHADPKAQLALAIRQLQDEHDQLEARVRGSHRPGANPSGQAATGHDAAGRPGEPSPGCPKCRPSGRGRAIAGQIVTVRQLVDTKKPAYEQAKTAAEQAQQAFRDNGEQLQQKMAEAKQARGRDRPGRDAAQHQRGHAGGYLDDVPRRAELRPGAGQGERPVGTGAGGLGADWRGRRWWSTARSNEAHLARQAAVDEVLQSLGGQPAPEAATPAPAPVDASPVASSEQARHGTSRGELPDGPALTVPTTYQPPSAHDRSRRSTHVRNPAHHAHRPGRDREGTRPPRRTSPVP